MTPLVDGAGLRGVPLAGYVWGVSSTTTEIGIEIDHASAVPPFEQLRAGIAARIGDGSLPPGAKLPPVRSLAVSLGLAANTVARSYRELETAGFVETRGRGGTVVAPKLDEPERHLLALELSRDYLAAMTALGVPREELGGYLDRV